MQNGLILVVNYNQGREVRRFLEKCLTVYSSDAFVFVDDGSTDDSVAIASEMGFKVLRHSVNLGIGAAIRTGIEEAARQGKKWVLITSANGKMHPEEFPSVAAPVIAGKADYVQGNRFADAGSHGLSLFRELTIPVFSRMASFFTGRYFADQTCGLRVYTLDILQKSGVVLQQEWLNKYELEYYVHYKICKNKAARIVEVPVTITYTHLEKGRKSKIRPFFGWWSMIRPFFYLWLGVKR